MTSGSSFTLQMNDISPFRLVLQFDSTKVQKVVQEYCSAVIAIAALSKPKSAVNSAELNFLCLFCILFELGNVGLEC